MFTHFIAVIVAFFMRVVAYIFVITFKKLYFHSVVMLSIVCKHCTVYCVNFFFKSVFLWFTDLELFRTQSNVKFISRALLFDLINEIIQKIYVGENNDVELQERTVNSSESKTLHRVSSAQFRLWRGPCP